MRDSKKKLIKCAELMKRHGDDWMISFKPKPNGTFDMAFTFEPAPSAELQAAADTLLRNASRIQISYDAHNKLRMFF